MAKHRARTREYSYLQRLQKFISRYVSLDYLKSVLLTSDHLNIVSIILLICEFFIGIFIINRVRYTEIDWKAYMQEVEGFMNGTLDYSYLKGDTGPLVYPAGFVYIFSLFYLLTGKGKDLYIAQYLYLGFYLLLLRLVFRIYCKSRKVPAYMLVIMCFTTYRMHSLFMLRLFNDPIAVILFYVSLNLFLEEKWAIGSVFFSLAVSVKMNILLYSPALLLAYLYILGVNGTVKNLIICGTLQLVLGLPFLVANPYAYLKGSFDLGRVFLYEWTVNWRFIPEEIFLNRNFHVLLLMLHLLCLGLFFPVFLKYLKSYASLKYVTKEVKKQLKRGSVNVDSVVQLFLYPFFVTNFIGIVFSRSLHYQFYVWYYHSLPYLLWCTKLKIITRLTILGIIELCWNTYPSTIWSSGALCACHSLILYQLYLSGKSNIK